MLTVTFNPADAEDRRVVDQIVSIYDGAATGGVEVRPTSPPTSPPPPPPATAKDDKYVIFHHDGEKRAGFAKSKDALLVLKDELGKVSTVDELDGFQKHNMPAMSRLDKKDMAEFQVSVGEKVGALREGPTPAGAEGTSEHTPADAGSGSNAPPETASTKSPSDGVDEAALAAMFAAPADPIAEVADANAMDKTDYIKAMMEIAKALGPQEGARWLKEEVKVEGVMGVKPEQYASVVAKGRAHIEKMKG